MGPSLEGFGRSEVKCEVKSEAKCEAKSDIGSAYVIYPIGAPAASNYDHVDYNIT